MKLNTTTDTLDRLWRILHGRRLTTKTVQVPAADLIALLKDHAILAEKAGAI